MTPYLETSVLIVVCALLDRLRGGWSIVPTAGHKLAGLSYGAILGLLLGLPLIWLPVLTLLWWLGEKPGWGSPMGWAVTGEEPKTSYTRVNSQWTLVSVPRKPEKWQVGQLKNHPWLSLIVRGAIWALPAMVIYPWQPKVLWLFGMTLAMPLGALFDRLTTRKYVAGEFVRGGMMGLICSIPLIIA